MGDPKMGEGKDGANWRYEVYFDPRADEKTGDSYYISDDELKSKLMGLVDAHEEIRVIGVYKVPLTDFQLTSILLYHNFVVFETKEWWWSIEKNDEGITIQRSKKMDAVLLKFRQTDRRDGVTLQKSDEGTKSISELIHWLWEEDELNDSYDLFESNCQEFAKRVFDYVAKTEYL